MSRAKHRGREKSTAPEPEPTIAPRGRRRLIALLVIAVVIGGVAGVWKWEQHVQKRWSESVASRQFDSADRWAARSIWPRSAEAKAFTEARVARLRYHSSRAGQILSEAESSGVTSARLRRESDLLDLQEGEDVSATKLQQLLELSGPDSDALFEAWIIGKLKQKDYVAAERVLSQWTSLEPDAATPHYYLGLMNSALEEHSLAEQEFREVLRRDAEFDDARVGLIEALAVLGRHRDALPVAEELVSRRGNDIEALMWRAQLLMDLDRPADAIPTLRACLTQNELLYDARYKLGLAYHLTDRPDDAATTLLPILDQFSEDIPTLYLLGEVEVQRGNAAKGRAYLMRYLEGQNEDRRLYRKAEKLTADLERGIAANAETLIEMGIAYMAIDWKSAKPGLLKLPQENLDDPRVLKNLLTIYEALGDDIEAEDIRARLNAPAK